MRGAALLVLSLSLVCSGCAYNAEKRASNWLVLESPGLRLRTPIARSDAVDIVGRRSESARSWLPRRPAATGSLAPIDAPLLPWGMLRDVVPPGAAAYDKKLPAGWLDDSTSRIISAGRAAQKRETDTVPTDATDKLE